jgi:hypothetical protein
MKKINFDLLRSEVNVLDRVILSKIMGGNLTPGDNAPGCYWNPNSTTTPGGGNFYWDGTYPLEGDFVQEQDPNMCD